MFSSRQKATKMTKEVMIDIFLKDLMHNIADIGNKLLKLGDRLPESFLLKLDKSEILKMH
jgi:hypothetical protein